MQQSPFGTPEGFDPPMEEAQAWRQAPAPVPVRAPGEELWSGVDITPQAAPPHRRRGRAVAAVAGSAVLVCGLVAGGAIAINAVGGGGDRPEQHLPRNTLMMAGLDLDPSLGQKVDAVRFLARLPLAHEKVEDDSDLREVLYDAITESVEDAPSWAQARAWVGDRVAVAVVPGADAKHPVEPVLVFEVSDEQAARDSLSSGGHGSLAVRDGWAALARTQQIADRVASTTQDTSLSADGTFSADLATLGEPGIATGWIDAKAAAAVLDSFLGDPGGLGSRGLDDTELSALEGLQRALPGAREQLGHGAAALRFDGPQLEVAMTMSGGRPAPVTGPSGIGDLPENSVLAISVTGLRQEFKDSWPAGGTDPLTEAGRALGLERPADLLALVGDRTQLVLAKRDGAPWPAVGLRTETDDPRAAKVLTDLTRATDSVIPLVGKRTENGFVLSTESLQLQALAAGKGRLGAQPGFASVLPDAASAQGAVYVDLAAYADLFQGMAGDLSKKDANLLKELGAAGMTVRREPDGSARLSIRVGVK